MEQIKYTIISIDDSRQSKKSHIRNVLFFYDEVKDIEFVNGSDTEQVKRIQKQFPNFKIHPEIWIPKKGELGVWYSQMQCWKWAADNNQHLIVFEDDAIIDLAFEKVWHGLLEELPATYDFLSIFVPDNQEQDYMYVVQYDEQGIPVNINLAPREEASTHYMGAQYLARAYQGYSCVATMYSPKGARKLLDLADRYGMYTPVDCFLFLRAHAGDLEAYAPKPSGYVKRVVSVDWGAPTTIHHTDKIGQEYI